MTKLNENFRTGILSSLAYTALLMAIGVLPVQAQEIAGPNSTEGPENVQNVDEPGQEVKATDVPVGPTAETPPDLSGDDTAAGVRDGVENGGMVEDIGVLESGDPGNGEADMLPELEGGNEVEELKLIPAGTVGMEGYPNPEGSPVVPIDLTTGQPIDVTPDYPGEDFSNAVPGSEVMSLPVSISNFSPSDFGGYEYYLGGIPTGFGKGPPGTDLNALSRGLSISGEVFGSYESNVTQGSGALGSPIDSDYILGVGANVSYLSTARLWTFGVRYSGDYEYYFENPDFSGFNQSIGLMANFEGSKLSATIGAGLTYQRGANRYVGVSNFVEQTTASVGGAASYQVGPRTSLGTTLSYNHIHSSGGDFEDTDSFGADLVALFQYSAITEFGPGVRFGYETGGGNDRVAIGPTLNLNYQLSKKVSLSSRVGLDFVDYSDGGSSGTDVSALLALNWEPSKIWGMDLTFYRGTTADPFIAGAFNEISSLSLGYSRKIRRVSLRLGASYEIVDTVGNTGGGGLPSGTDYFSLEASAGIMLFKDSTDLRVFIRYNDMNGDSASSFDNTIVGFSLSKEF